MSRGRSRGRETQADSVEPAKGLDPMMPKSRSELKSRIGGLTDCAPQACSNTFFLNSFQNQSQQGSLSVFFLMPPQIQTQEGITSLLFSLFLPCAFTVVGGLLATPLVPCSSERSMLALGKSWKLLSPTCLTCALAKTPEVPNKSLICL